MDERGTRAGKDTLPRHLAPGIEAPELLGLLWRTAHDAEWLTREISGPRARRALGIVNSVSARRPRGPGAMREVMATLDDGERGVALDGPAAGAGRPLVRSAAARALSDLDRDGVPLDLAPGGRYVVELVACAVEWLLADLACWVGLSPATRTVGDLVRLKDGAKAAARVLALAAYLRLGGERRDAGGARGVPSPEEFAQTVRRALTMISEQGKAGAGG